MRLYIFAFFFLSFLSYASGIGREGRNYDPFEKKRGEFPYEMEGRKEEMPPTLTFENCNQWIITPVNAEAALFRTREERVFSEYSGKVVYTTLDKKAGFRMELKEPLLLEDWDCIELWNYGDHWCWGEPHYTTAMKVYVIIRDTNGQEYRYPIVQAGYEGLIHKYWFLSHFKLPEPFNTSTYFVGYDFYCEQPDTGTEHTIYLGNTYIFKEKLEPFTYKPFPEQIPFPVRKETIAPSVKGKAGKTIVKTESGRVLFEYKNTEVEFQYEITLSEPLGPIYRIEKKQKTLLNQNSKIVFANQTNVKWQKEKLELKADTLVVSYIATGENLATSFICKYYLHEQSLVWNIEELAEEGSIAEIRLGGTQIKKEAQLIPIPFLVYNYSSYRPCILYDNDRFYFSMFDWYYTNSSEFFAENNHLDSEYGVYNGGVRYIPLINGKRNPVRERLFWNISRNVHEVLPTVDNPPSPMREYQADRFWYIGGGNDLTALRKDVNRLRSKGIEKVSIRYHEDFWRKDGESFTFRLEPSPDINKEDLREYVRFVHSKDWRIGFYSNYTDLSPVNQHWHRDHMKIGPKGEWEVAWSRTYSPKPHFAWEQQAYFAPRIQQLFGTNHSYCDVHTAISPMSRVDYDFRSPGAGMFRSVINYYGMILLNERRAYGGPVYSEGGNHWWYAGLVDGNYANDDLLNLPVFPDFQLLKLNTLEMDAANRGKGHQYIAYALAYGNIGMVHPSTEETIRRYALLQPLQPFYSMIPIKEISYSDGRNYYDTSEAIKRKLLDKPRLVLEYQSGLKVYTNLSNENWQPDKTDIVLPSYGFYASTPDKAVHASSILDTNSGQRIDRTHSPHIHYLNAYGNKTEGELAGTGHYMLKKEKFGWEIIPVDYTGTIDFSLSLIGYEKYEVDIKAIDENGNTITTINQHPLSKQVQLKPERIHYKYQIIPVRTKADQK